MSFAEQGEKRIEWVSMFMPVLNSIKDRFEKEKPFKGMTIGMALHVEPKTCYLVRTLEAGGAKVAITGCNPLSTQDDAVEAIKASGTAAYAKHGQSNEAYYESLNKILDAHPGIVIDDGCDLITLLHKDRPEQIKEIRGGCEETTTGIHRLIAMHKDNALKFPVIDVNDAESKHFFDNYYGTGESTLTAIMITTNTMISGKRMVVGGYGFCGRGIANKARGMGALVTVTEIDPVKALQARMDGFRVMPMREAIKDADYVVTVAGMKHVVDEQSLKNAKDKCILANSGHFDIEIDLEALKKMAKKATPLNADIVQYDMPGGKKLFILADGRLVNLAASKGLGHPIEVMDMSFALQALSAEHILNTKLKPGVYPVPEKIDKLVSDMKLSSMGVKKDKLTKEQEKYANAWDEGT